MKVMLIYQNAVGFAMDLMMKPENFPKRFVIIAIASRAFTSIVLSNGYKLYRQLSGGLICYSESARTATVI